MIQLAEQATARNPGTSVERIDPDVAEVREVDLYAPVARRLPGVAVPPALHRQKQPAVVSREIDSAADVGNSRRLNDQRWVLVEVGIEDLPRLVVSRVAGEQETPRSLVFRSAMAALDRVISLPSPVTAVRSGGVLGASR